MCSGRFRNLHVNRDLARGRKPNSFSTTSNTESKTKTPGKLQPRASAARKPRETQGQAGGRAAKPFCCGVPVTVGTLSRGRSGRTACRASPGQCSGYFVLACCRSRRCTCPLAWWDVVLNRVSWRWGILPLLCPDTRWSLPLPVQCGVWACV